MALAPTTLHGRLLRLLWWPLLGVLVAGAALGDLQALDRARSNQDLALARIAVALASRLDVDADEAREGQRDDDLGLHFKLTMAAMARSDRQDERAFAVIAQDGALIGGDTALLALADPSALQAPAFADQHLAGQAVRVVSYPHASALGKATVVVAETTRRRQAQAHDVLIDTLLPSLAMMVLAMLLLRLGVQRALAPLDQLDQSVASRTPDDLSPLPETPLPAELQPLVQAINRLMSHLRAAADQQQSFLSDAAHQLRTPLAGVQTQLELARSDTRPAQRVRLDAMAAALQRMGRITHQMLALARSGPEAVRAADFVPVNLQSLLEDAASLWLDAAIAADVDLGFDAQPAWVRGSSWMLGELLGNLVHNAIRHSPPQGRVTVRCGAGAGGCWLSVEDAGPGIPETELPRVFERFYQAPGAAAGGSGLGLAIVREVALRHGGSVQLGPAPAGRGLLVRVLLLALDGAPPAA